MIMNLNPEDRGSTASKTLVSNHLTTWCNNPENHDFYSVPWEPRIMQHMDSFESVEYEDVWKITEETQDKVERLSEGRCT
jgi:hypothetical protein